MGKFIFTQTEIPGVVVIEPQVFGDDRGYFMETYNQRDMESLGFQYEFVQDNQSGSTYGVLRGLRSSVVESRTADLARAFDLTDALGRTVSDYSTGMTKKIMLAGAMIHSPRVLVLDEPFESVDPVSSAVILDILAAYVDHGGTVILSSHGMELVERVCSGVAVIVAGQVLAQGTVDAVRGDLTLEQRFIELAGGLGDAEGLEWLHTFSD